MWEVADQMPRMCSSKLVTCLIRQLAGNAIQLSAGHMWTFPEPRGIQVQKQVIQLICNIHILSIMIDF